MKQAQKGFTIIETLLALLVVVAIGFGGYWVWHSQDQKSTTSTSTPAASSSTSQTSTQKYLTITEWGVRMTLPSGLNNAIYQITGNKVDLSTSYLKSLSECNQSGNTFNAKYITRYNSGDTNDFYEPVGDVTVAEIYINRTNNDQMYGTDLSNTLKKVGSYYYYLSGNQSSGCEDPQTGQAFAQMDQAVDYYQSAFKTLTGAN